MPSVKNRTKIREKDQSSNSFSFTFALEKNLLKAIFA